MATIRLRGKKWHVQVRRSGQPSVTKSFGQRATALAWARQMEHQADTVGLVRVCRTASSRLALGDLVRRYQVEVSPRKKGYDIEICVLNRFLAHPMCRKLVTEVTVQDFATYRDQRLKEIKATTLRRQLTVIGNVYEVANREWGIELANPVPLLRLSAPHQHRERRLQPGELCKIHQFAENLTNPYVLPIIRVAVGTAMRRGEILAIRWCDLDWANSTLRIPNTKNGHARTIPLANEMISVFKALVPNEGQPGDKVFPISANALRLAWTRLCQRLDIKDLRFHDLRHEAISRFVEQGLSTPEVALISGHRDMRMLFRYTHPLVQAVRAKLNHAK